MRFQALVLAVIFGFASSAWSLDKESIDQARRAAQELAATNSQNAIAPGEASASVGKLAEGMVLCVGFLGLIAWILKRKKISAGKVDGDLVILDRIGISPKNHLLLLEVCGKKVLVTVGSDHSSLIQLSGEKANLIKLNPETVVESAQCESKVRLSA